MFLAFWIFWAFVGLAAATLLFAWSVKTHQFENSRRAALIPFDDLEPAKSGSTKEGRTLFLTIMTMLVLGVISIVVMLVLAFLPR